MVGYDVENDLRVLEVEHPKDRIVDVADLYKQDGEKVSLKSAAKSNLGWDIQMGPHNPVEDAQAAMKLYQRKGG